jgi:hypothetical protein
MSDSKYQIKAKVRACNPSTGDYESAGVIAYNSLSDQWGFVYSSKFDGDIDPINLPNGKDRVFLFDGNKLPGVFADLMPGEFVDSKLRLMIPGYKEKNNIGKILELGSRDNRGIRLEVGGNKIYGIKPTPDTLADFDERMRSYGYRAWFDNEELDLIKNKVDCINFLAKSYSKQNQLVRIIGPDHKEYLIKQYPPTGSSLNRVRLEKTAQDLAKSAGARVPDSKIIELQLGTEALIQKRYDVYDEIEIVRRTISIKSLLSSDSMHGIHYDKVAEKMGIIEGYEMNSGSAQPNQLIANKIDLFRHSLINHVINNIDNHGENMEMMIRNDGKWEMAPIYDLGFFNDPQELMSAFYGDPPIHNASITDDDFVSSAWDSLDIPVDKGVAFQIRDNVINAVLKDLPRIMQKNGVGLIANGQNSREMNHIISSIGVQHSELSKELTKAILTEYENERVKNINLEKDNSPGMNL